MDYSSGTASSMNNMRPIFGAYAFQGHKRSMIFAFRQGLQGNNMPLYRYKNERCISRRILESGQKVPFENDKMHFGKEYKTG
ncbi:jg3416 [Pararge aegeria aegeria]|uniref:Jg3416 protein n=1 Tax=Pararge aegeria aegeria TaxID=348720 RepID=A0A8S4RS79_9NEOP|nr:jg3416 [Pararge aegeria aegeria]